MFRFVPVLALLTLVCVSRPAEAAESLVELRGIATPSMYRLAWESDWQVPEDAGDYEYFVAEKLGYGAFDWRPDVTGNWYSKIDLTPYPQPWAVEWLGQDVFRFEYGFAGDSHAEILSMYPVSIPEPSTFALVAVIGGAALLYAAWWAAGVLFFGRGDSDGESQRDRSPEVAGDAHQASVDSTPLPERASRVDSIGHATREVIRGDGPRMSQAYADRGGNGAGHPSTVGDGPGRLGVEARPTPVESGWEN